jgi:hypothetical protein
VMRGMMRGGWVVRGRDMGWCSNAILQLGPHCFLVAWLYSADVTVETIEGRGIEECERRRNTTKDTKTCDSIGGRSTCTSSLLLLISAS